MDTMASTWNCSQSMEELKYRLYSTTLELKSLQMAAWEERKRSEETITQLRLLLNVSLRERDEAKEELQKLLNKMCSQPQPQPLLQPDTSPPKPTGANSSVTESNSLSDTNRPFLDAASSPDFQSMCMADSGAPLFDVAPSPDFQSMRMAGTARQPALQADPGSVIIGRIAMGKQLPEKGKLLQAVMDAGPLLQTLLLAGPLPQWRNPPPPQAFQIPIVPLGGNGGQASTCYASLSGSVVTPPAKKRPHFCAKYQRVLQ